jgi:hypothetical protein
MLRACAVLAPVTVVVYVTQLLVSPPSPGLRLLEALAAVSALVFGVLSVRDAHRIPALAAVPAAAGPVIDLRDEVDLRDATVALPAGSDASERSLR